MKKQLFILILSVFILTGSVVAQTDPIIDFLNKGSNANSANQELEARLQEYFRAVISLDEEGIYKFLNPKYATTFASKAKVLEMIREEIKLNKSEKLKILSIKIKSGAEKLLNNSSPQKVAVEFEFLMGDNPKDAVTFDGELTAILVNNNWYFYHKNYFINSFQVLALYRAVDDNDEEEATKPTPAATPKTNQNSDGSVVNGGVVNGKAVSLPAPEYPKSAQAVGASGSVNVQVLISENGDVLSAKAITGHPLLQETAVEAAKKAKFRPVFLQGQPVKISGIIVYNFNK